MRWLWGLSRACGCSDKVEAGCVLFLDARLTTGKLESRGSLRTLLLKKECEKRMCEQKISRCSCKTLACCGTFLRDLRNPDSSSPNPGGPILC